MEPLQWHSAGSAEMPGLPKGIDIDGAIQLVDAIPQQ